MMNSPKMNNREVSDYYLYSKNTLIYQNKYKFSFKINNYIEISLIRNNINKNYVNKVLRKSNSQPKILHSAKLSFKN